MHVMKVVKIISLIADILHAHCSSAKSCIFGCMKKIILDLASVTFIQGLLEATCASDGVRLPRLDTRQYNRKSLQLPPRFTRPEALLVLQGLLDGEFL